MVVFPGVLLIRSGRIHASPVGQAIQENSKPFPNAIPLLAHAIRIGTRSVAGHNLNPRMLTQPSRQGLGLSVR
jgi:hypothetical protein